MEMTKTEYLLIALLTLFIVAPIAIGFIVNGVPGAWIGTGATCLIMLILVAFDS